MIERSETHGYIEQKKMENKIENGNENERFAILRCVEHYRFKYDIAQIDDVWGFCCWCLMFLFHSVRGCLRADLSTSNTGIFVSFAEKLSGVCVFRFKNIDKKWAHVYSHFTISNVFRMIRSTLSVTGAAMHI